MYQLPKSLTSNLVHTHTHIKQAVVDENSQQLEASFVMFAAVETND